MKPEDVLQFWFEEIDSRYWWKKDVQFDQLISDRFGETHKQAACCELSHWRNSANGRLAEVIILDQFSRNIFRDLPQAFSQDPLALALAQEAIANNADVALEEKERGFLYMPFMHSESLAIHETAEGLYKALENQSTYEFELKHKAIIEKFRRYPHRNAILGRESTREELDFLKQPGSSF